LLVKLKGEHVPVKTYQDLLAWQRAMELVESVYRVTAKFPRHEIFALTKQLRRAAVSVPSNIAEGQGRGACDAFAYHLRVALGSVQEIETQLSIGHRLEYVSNADISEVMQLADETGKLLRGLLKSLAEPNVQTSN
jgi:four helix bundle protein